jgi:hypothetical protein
VITSDRVGRVAAVTVVGALVGLGFAGAVAAFGIKVLVVPVVVFGAWLLVLRPWWALAIFAVVTVLCEEDPTQALISQEAFFHQALSGFVLSPANFLLIIVVLAIVLDVRRSRRAWRTPGLLTGPLLFLAALTAFGAVVGHSNGTHDTTQLLDQVRSLTILIVLPFAIVNLPRPRGAVRGVVIAAGILAGLVGLQGLATYAAGAGRAIDGVTITYLSETPNLFTILLILGALAFVVGRGRLPKWATACAVLALLSLVLSFLRSFWLGAIVGLVVVIVAVRGGRRSRLIPIAVVAAAVILSLATGVVGGAQGALALRFSQLSPTQVTTSQDDRYRLDETRNVWREIQNHPVSGLGLGVPWRIRDPLSQTLPQGTFYNHFALLWFWLHLGILGPIGYLWLLGAGLLEALRVGRRDHDVVIRAAGIAAAAGIVTLAVAELTATYTGADPRFDALLGLVLGWVVWARTERTEPGPHDEIDADVVVPIAWSPNV